MIMKIAVFDVMLHGKFVCTLEYEYSPLFPIKIEDLDKFVIDNRPELEGKPYNIKFIK